MTHVTLEHASLDFPVLGDSAQSLRSVLAAALSRRRRNAIRTEVVSALSDVSLQLTNGTKLGLLGANGAGKSTLLRLIAGIYEPTEGTIQRSGNVMPMFDLSYGMDEDASGYENIEIASTMLGVARSRMENVIQDIEEFSDLGTALYRPIRTYSAGMRVRLAFGLATSIKADILLIDEIIGVGDTRFMKKARERVMKQVQQAGILLLASHAEAVLRDFCTTGIVMAEGKVTFHGSIDDAISFYNTGRAP